MNCKRRSAFLAESIESILGQTFRNFEFIIVDFGSTDKSKAIAVSYAAKDSRIRFREIPNCVLPAARNAACSFAQGQYIAVMDADDICLPDRLRLEVEFMEQHAEVGLLGSAVTWVDSNNRGRSASTHIRAVIKTLDWPSLITARSGIPQFSYARKPLRRREGIGRRLSLLTITTWNSGYRSATNARIWGRCC